MTNQQSQYPDEDLDRTDQLPILEGTLSEHDVEDDAVRMDHTAVLPGSALVRRGCDRLRAGPPSVDLPSLAESVRSVEERIARQNAEYEALTRAHERAREAETTAVARAHALAVDLASARSALESEQTRSREMDRTLTERSAAMEAARVRAEEALRESERHQGESQTLRDSLAAREATHCAGAAFSRRARRAVGGAAVGTRQDRAGARSHVEINRPSWKRNCKVRAPKPTHWRRS